MNTAEQIRPVLPDGRSGIRPIRMFLADDSHLTMALLARILSKHECITIVGAATDGWRAACLAPTLRPDLVLMDLGMPGLDGAEVTRRLKRQPDPPIIFVATSDYSPEAQDRCLAAGVDAFLAKTADLPAQLRTAIQHWFGPRSSATQTTPLP
jgi:CheY-like chemotaxis protein